MFLVSLLYFLFASTFIIGKISLFYADPILIISIRMLISGLLIFGYLYFFKKIQFDFSKNNFLFYMQMSFFHIYLPFLLEFWALQYMSAAKTCIIYSLSPFISAFFSFLMFDEKFTFKKSIGLLIGFIGFLPVLVSKGEPVESSQFHLFFLSLPELALLASTIFSAYAWVLFRKKVKKETSFLTVNSISMLGGGFLALLTYIFLNGFKFSIIDTMPFIYCIIFMILIANIICYNLYGYLLKKYTATFLSFAGFLTPIFTDILGRMFLGERVTLGFYLTFIFVFIGLYIFYKQELLF